MGMRVVVTGREGQIARSLIERAHGSTEVIALARPQLDLAGPEDKTVAAIEKAQPSIVVSAAAFTQVDRAETESDLAFSINERGARAVARAARQLGVPLIHLSTDYVFDGSKSSPYLEADEPRPTSVYGASKLAGEQAVLAEHDNLAVLRTAWVYSPFGANFVKTMLRLALDRDEVSVVTDQRGNPTSALDIADGIFKIAANLCAGDDPRRRGIFHMASARPTSWAGFAEAVFACSRRNGGPTAEVKHILTADYSTISKRPANSLLDSGKLSDLHAVTLPDWHPSLEVVVDRLTRAVA